MRICENARLRGRRSIFFDTFRDKSCPSPMRISTGNVVPCRNRKEKEPSRKPSVMELLIAVLRHGFMVVAALTKALPVALVPEQLRIPSVGDDVVNHGCFHQPSLLHAPDAEGMCFQETFPCFLPSAIVSPDGCACPVRGVQPQMFFTVHPVRQLRASRMPAWFHWFPRHGVTTSSRRRNIYQRLPPAGTPAGSVISHSPFPATAPVLPSSYGSGRSRLHTSHISSRCTFHPS